MALDARTLGHRLAATLREHRFRRARSFWHHVWSDVISHIRAHMDLWEVIRTFKLDEDTTSFTVPAEDAFVVWHTGFGKGPYTVTLPADPFEGQYVVVKDGGGNASTDKILVDPNGNTIDGVAGVEEIALNFLSVTYLYDGDEWHRLSSGGATTGSIFAAQQIESASVESTSATAPQDAFLGETPNLITISADGDYLIYFETAYKLSNANSTARIAVGKNGINAQAGSNRVIGGNKPGSAIVIKRLDGLVVGDTVHGVFSLVSGGGSIDVKEKSLSVIRIA